MKPSMLANWAVVALATLANSWPAPDMLFGQPSHAECAMSTKFQTFGIACSLLSANSTPCSYSGVEAWHVDRLWLVTAFRSESGSMTATILRLAYLGLLNRLTIGVM